MSSSFSVLPAAYNSVPIAWAQLRASAVTSVLKVRTFSDFSPDDAWNSLLRERDCAGFVILIFGGREGWYIAGDVFTTFIFLL